MNFKELQEQQRILRILFQKRADLVKKNDWATVEVINELIDAILSP